MPDRSTAPSPTARPASAPDCLVIGGGVIGLTAAYRLARDGVRTMLVDRGPLGREASWAGAGILPPASWYSEHPAIERLALRASRMNEELSAELREATGVDDEYERCGALYLQSERSAGRLAAAFARWRACGVEVAPAGDTRGFAAAWSVPAEAQVRNPRRLRALSAGCRKLGVRLREGVEVRGFCRSDGRITGVETSAGPLTASLFLVTAGCWSPRLLAAAGVGVAGRPIRGQMLLVEGDPGPGPEVVHHPPYYLVRRRDGRVLVGATVEDVGFDRSTTAAARRELTAAAERMAPGVTRGTRPLRFWAGLRPGGADGLPHVGKAPGLDNLWIASGHHRAGLQLAAPTAELVSRMLRGEGVGPEADSLAPRVAPATARADGAGYAG